MRFYRHTSLITLPINFWQNSDLFEKEKHFFSSNIDRFREIWRHKKFFRNLYWKSNKNSIHGTTSIFSRGTLAQHLTLVCGGGVWCPLDGCNALIGQRGTSVQLYTTVHLGQCTLLVYTNNSNSPPGILAWASTLYGSPTMAILWPAFFHHQLFKYLVLFVWQGMLE